MKDVHHHTQLGYPFPSTKLMDPDVVDSEIIGKKQFRIKVGLKST